LVPANGR